MHRRFEITGFIVRFKTVKNGILITVKEPTHNKIAKPNYERLAIWGPKALAIHPKLKNGARFNFKGEITTRNYKGKVYDNNTIDQWKPLEQVERKFKPREEPDDDWNVPEPQNRDSKAHRLGEGF